MYDVNAEIKENNVVDNKLTQLLDKSCVQLGKLCKTWGFGNKNVDINFSAFDGLVNKNNTLVKDVAEYVGGILGIQSEDITDHKALFFDYLASVSICYVEVSKYTTKNDVKQHTYDKFLCTKNPKIIQKLLNEHGEPTSLEEINKKFAVQLAPSDNDDFWCVRLNLTGKRIVTKPRKAYDASKIRVTPVFMINSYLKGIIENMKTKILEFTYLKDNDTERVLVTTLNKGVLEKFYNRQYMESVQLQVDLVTKLNRGYIRVPELGASIYDSGTRSINVARITKIRELQESEVNTDFINVDLESVQSEFLKNIDYIALHMPDELAPLYEDLTESKLESTPVTAQLAEMIKSYANANCTVLSTTFIRRLHTFMISNPIWFPYYTGERSSDNLSMQTKGVYL